MKPIPTHATALYEHLEIIAEACHHAREVIAVRGADEFAIEYAMEIATQALRLHRLVELARLELHGNNGKTWPDSGAALVVKNSKAKSRRAGLAVNLLAKG